MRSEILSLLWKHKKTRPQTDLPSLLFINASLQSFFSLQWPTCSLCFLSLPWLSISFSLECSFSSLPQALSLWCGNFILSSHSWISSFCFYTFLLFLPTVSSTQWLGHFPLSDAEIAPVFLAWSTPTYIQRPERSDCIFSLPTFPPPLTASLSDLIPGSTSSTLTSLLLIECCRPDYVVGPFPGWSLLRLLLLQTCT